MFSRQNFILDPLGDIGDVPGCDQLHAQSHVLWEAKAVRGSQPGHEALIHPLSQPSPASLGAHLEEDEEGEPGCEDVPELDGVGVVVSVAVIPVPAAQLRQCQPRPVPSGLDVTVRDRGWQGAALTCTP